MNADFQQLTTTLYDLDTLKNEILAAEKKHSFLRKTVIGWESIPIRSVDGLEGDEGNMGGGKNNSANPGDYMYTSVADCCPYLKSILESFGAPILKVRILKLIKGRKIGQHIDQFGSEAIIRFHIPVVSHPKVKVFVEKESRYLEPGYLYWLNVRKNHRVENNSTVDRIHIVFDLYRNENVDKLFNAKK